MQNSSLNELKVIAKIIGIKGCKSALIASESTRNEDHDADPASINKTIGKIRREIVMKAKYLEILILNLIQKKIIMNLKKLLVLLIITIFNMRVLEKKTKLYYLKIILM